MKRTIVAIIFVLILAGGAMALHKSDTAAPIDYAEAGRLVASSKCDSGDKSLQIGETDLQAIHNTAVTHILDVPAGTQVTVYLKSYSSNNVSGSIRYAKNYGNYNFVLSKSSSSKDEWKFKSFEACKI